KLLLEREAYLSDSLSQNTFVIKKWTYREFTLSITVTKGNKTLLRALFDGISSTVQENRLLIQYNNMTKEVSLLLNNVTRDDEGLYQISTSIYETAAEVPELIDKKRNVQLHVLDSSEIKQGYAGDNILITEFVDNLIFSPRLYHKDQLIAVLRDSDCDVSTSSPFYGRIRCSKDKENSTTTIIEIKTVSETDTGLYTVETEGSVTQRCFLNITGTNTNITSALISVTPPERIDENNSDQPSNITLSTTVLSEIELIHILPITTVAIFAILLFLGSLIRIQRRNNKRFKSVQRIILETMEATSIAAFSTLPRCSHTPSREDIWTSNSNSLRNTATHPAELLQYRTPMDSTPDHNTCHNTTEQLEDEYSSFDVTDTIVKVCESRSRSNKTSLAECYESPGSIIDVCPFRADVVCAAECEVHFDRGILYANDQAQVYPSTDATYAVVKKFSSINNVKAGGSCNDASETVDLSHCDNATNGVQNEELTLGSETQNPSVVGMYGISTSVVDFNLVTKVE
ncbi:hypothetical protein ACJMK2_033187, partial [Sinanodonta woodiana]